MTENAVKQAFHRLRQRYRQLLRDEIAQTVAVPGDVEDELRHFISVLQANHEWTRIDTKVSPESFGLWSAAA